jgi:hypothetical protein
LHLGLIGGNTERLHCGQLLPGWLWWHDGVPGGVRNIIFFFFFSDL